MPKKHHPHTKQHFRRGLSKPIFLVGIATLALLYIAITILMYFYGTGFLGNIFRPRLARDSQSVSPAPSPRPINPLPSGRQEYALTHGKKATGPKPKTIVIDPLTPAVGEGQTVTIAVVHDSPVTGATVTLFTDSDNHTYPLKLTGGTATNGSWSASWTMPESYDYRYQLKFTLVSSTGNWINTMKFRQ